MKQLLNIKVI